MNVSEALERVYREDYGRIVATVIRLMGGDFAAAEETVQEAFEAALQQWPREGVPDVPRAWLIRTSRNRAVDRVRRSVRLKARVAELEAEAIGEIVIPTEGDWPGIEDDQLRLLFTCCHPALAPEAQVALALRTLCGLTTEEVARAFLVSSETMAQRLVRAQRKIRDAKIPYVIPEPDALGERLEAVLQAIYLVFSEGYAATRGAAQVRVDLCEEAIRLGRTARRLLPHDPEVASLLALMLLHHSRRHTRMASDGAVLLLDHQDRAKWDRVEIEEGTAILERALATGAHGVYAIQAAIATLHAQAPTPDATDWRQIAELYQRLFALQPTAVVALNRAAAVAMAEGPERGLAQIDDLERSGALKGYHLLPAARADLLRRLGRREEAAQAYAEAVTLVTNEPERRFLLARLAELRVN